jgi:hypothetical protein
MGTGTLARLEMRVKKRAVKKSYKEGKYQLKG